MRKPGILMIVLALLAACQPAPSATPTDLPTAIVTELPTGMDVTAEATETADTAAPEATADVTGEPASATEVSAVTGAATAEATADLETMMPGAYCLEITGLEDEPVVMRLADGQYTYEFEGAGGEESTTGAAPNVVPTSLHTLRFQDSGGQYAFILTFSDQITLGTYPLGTSQMAGQSGGVEATAAMTGANGLYTGPTLRLTGACAAALREAGLEVTPEAGATMTGTAVDSATASPQASAVSTEAAAETVPAPSARATATGAAATVVASGSDTQPGGEVTPETTAGAALNTTPASPAEPSEITGLMVIGARLEPLGEDGESYILLQDGTLEIFRYDQRQDVILLDGAFALTLASAADSTAAVTVSGFFVNLPVNQTPR